jgi:hypothetical protein
MTMPGSKTIYIDLQKLGNAGPDAATVMRLLMAAGDAQIATICMGKCNPESSIFNQTLRQAATVYFLRLQCGHIREAVVTVMKDIEESTCLRSCISELPHNAQEAYHRLLDCTKKPGSCDFANYVERIRSNVVFHYQQRATGKALNRLAKRKTHPIAKITSGSDISRWRFHAADLCLREMIRDQWELPDGDIEQQLKGPLSYLSDLCDDLLLFAFHFAWRHLQDYRATI